MRNCEKWAGGLAVLMLLLASQLFAQDQVAIITSLADPIKLASLKGDRPANRRVRQMTYWLWDARAEGKSPEGVADSVMERIGWKGTTRGKLTAAAMVRNFKIAGELGCLTPEGLALLRKGNAPRVGRGPYIGDIVSVDHIIPKSVVSELDTVIANLELMPSRMNEKKSAKIETRQHSLAVKLHAAGLLSEEGFRSVSNRD